MSATSWNQATVLGAMLGLMVLLGPGRVHADEPAEVSPDAESAVPLLEPPAYEPPDAETARLRTRAAAKGLRCPVCQGLSVADSNADSARAMYDRIAELVAQGYSEEQVLDYFSDRYGEWVRLEPAAEGLNLIIFVLPAAVLVLGGLFLVSRSRPAAAPLPAMPALSGEANEEYRRRILEELGDGP